MNEPLTSDSWRKTPAKKDTRKWCKGKVGRQHETALRIQRYLIPLRRSTQCGPRNGHSLFWGGGNDETWVCYHEQYCVKCGKIDWSAHFRCPNRPAA
jgi:hypothetical protein